MHRHLILVIALLFLAQHVSSASIHGRVFEWSTLDELNNVIITINSTPEQRIVSKEGSYAFEVPSGDYSIHAVLLENNKAKYAVDENLSIKADGNYVLDLIMLPLLDVELGLEELADAGLDFQLDENSFDKNNNGVNNGLNSFLLPASILLLALIAGFLLLKGKPLMQAVKPANKTGRGETGSIETPALPAEKTKRLETKPAAEAGLEAGLVSSRLPSLDADERKVIEAVRLQGGRITQLDLRKKIDVFGEAKLSLVVSDLEDKGLVKKIKRGRGNIIVLSSDLR
ncbi:hypothetical protein HZB89_00805 [archaeon]|nr:hypothetical protein [archaeon]